MVPHDHLQRNGVFWETNKGFRARSSGQDAGAATTFEQAYNSVTKGLGLWSMIMVKTHFASTLIEKKSRDDFY